MRFRFTCPFGDDIVAGDDVETARIDGRVECDGCGSRFALTLTPLDSRAV